MPDCPLPLAKLPSLRVLLPAVKLFDPIPPRTIPPNAITATAMSFGMASIYLSLSGGALADAAWFVLIAVLLDKLDGSIARALKGSSEFGVQFDSFADAVAFGTAPAALVFAAARSLTPQTWGPGAQVLGVLPATPVLAAICLAYAVMTSVRLARFNVTTEANGPYLFLGLPSTLSGGLLASAFLTIGELGLPLGLHALFPLALVLNAALMVSNLPLPKFKPSARKPLRVLQFGAATAVYLLIPLRVGFTAVLLMLLVYLALGFSYLGPKMLAEHRAARA